MRRAPAAAVLLPAYEAAASNVGQRNRLAIAQRHVEVLPPARLCAGKQRGHDAVAGVESRRQVGDGDSNFDGRPVSGARDVHQAKLGLHHDIVTGSLGVRARLAVACDGRVDQGRVDLVHCLEVEPVLFEGSGNVILN